MKKPPGPGVTVHPGRTPHTYPAAADMHAPGTSPEPQDTSSIDETQLKILSIIAKSRGRAQNHARATLGARGPISAARGMVPTDKHHKERRAAEDVNPEKKDSSVRGCETDNNKKEGKPPISKAERRRRRKNARKQGEAERREKERNGEATEDYDAEVLAAYWAAVASLERRIEGSGLLDSRLAGRLGPLS